MKCTGDVYCVIVMSLTHDLFAITSLTKDNSDMSDRRLILDTDQSLVSVASVVLQMHFLVLSLTDE